MSSSEEEVSEVVKQTLSELMLKKEEGTFPFMKVEEENEKLNVGIIAAKKCFSEEGELKGVEFVCIHTAKCFAYGHSSHNCSPKFEISKLNSNSELKFESFFLKW